jgi:N-acetylmuramoyl-L-alanine amidase
MADERDLVEHLVAAGDCIASIAARVGRSIQEIWDLDANRELRELRADPYVLAPGDRVKLPKAPPRGFVVTPGQRHVFRRRGTHVDFELTASLNKKPRANLGFTLVVDGDALHPIEGQTDSEGTLRTRIPARAREGRLTFSDGRCPMKLRFGMLDPIDTTSGVQARLHALAYYYRPIDGAAGPYTARALRNFQRDRGLPLTGVADDATKAALREAYGR